jgi:hypothetical protein
MFENGMLRRSEREEIKRGLRKLNKKELIVCTVHPVLCDVESM